MSASSNDGSGNGGAEGAVARPTFEEALAAMPDRDRVDKLAIFAVTQTHELARMFEGHAYAISRLVQEQADALIGMMKLQAEQIALLEAEVARLKARETLLQ